MVECSPALVSGVPLQHVSLIGTSEIFFDQFHGCCQVFMIPVSQPLFVSLLLSFRNIMVVYRSFWSSTKPRFVTAGQEGLWHRVTAGR